MSITVNVVRGDTGVGVGPWLGKTLSQADGRAYELGGADPGLNRACKGSSPSDHTPRVVNGEDCGRQVDVGGRRFGCVPRAGVWKSSVASAPPARTRVSQAASYPSGRRACLLSAPKKKARCFFLPARLGYTAEPPGQRTEKRHDFRLMSPANLKTGSTPRVALFTDLVSCNSGGLMMGKKIYLNTTDTETHALVR